MAARLEAVVGGTEADDILLKDFTYDLRPGYVRAFPRGEAAKLSGKGYLFPERFSEFEAQIRELEIRPDDVWVASYPKCGEVAFEVSAEQLAFNIYLYYSPSGHKGM